jgi:hypothetical protein
MAQRGGARWAKQPKLCLPAIWAEARSKMEADKARAKLRAAESGKAANAGAPAGPENAATKRPRGRPKWSGRKNWRQAVKAA